METSDSECFESADEDFSNDEDTETVKNNDVIKSTKNKEKNDVEETSERLEALELLPVEPEVNATIVDDNRNKETTKIPVKPLEDSQTETNANVVVVKESKITSRNKPKKQLESADHRRKSETKSKLGVKTPEICKETLDDNADSKVMEEPNKSDLVIVKQEPAAIHEIKPINQEIRHEIKEADADLWGDDEDWGPTEPQTKEQVNESNMWENDDWEPIEDIKETEKPHNFPQQSQKQSWGGWGGWDVSSLINTATQGVSSLTQGISTALETGMGAPDPEEMARINKASKEKERNQDPEHPTNPNEDDCPDRKNSSFGLGNFVMGVSHLTKLVESTSTKVISGGLDTLETIGKKTMEVLQDGDPGLKKKRAFLKIDQDKPVLSQLLREAKEKAENENKALEERHYAKRAKNYETLFDDHQGLVHLEALEMLSKQCDMKLQSLLESYSDEALIDLQETMEQVKELCELPDEDEDEQANFGEIKEKLESVIAEINVPITYKRLIETWEETESWLTSLKFDVCDEREIHQQAIETLAQLTAIAVEQFHKAGELLLVKERRSTADEADSLVQLTTSLAALIGIVAGKFSDKLNAKSSSARNKEEVNGLITNVFFEAANSSSYIQDAFQLLIPVLQVGAV